MRAPLPIYSRTRLVVYTKGCTTNPDVTRAPLYLFVVASALAGIDI